MKISRRTIGHFDVRVWSGGAGSQVLYLHGFEQHPGQAPFLEKLAETHEVMAPEHPGYGSSTGFERLHDLQDLVLYYRTLVERWGKGPIDVIGHSLGGMFAAELALMAPHLVRRLVLVSPYGLWMDEQPLELNTINLTTAAKFMWPIPDKGLSRRLLYLTAPTLVIHGLSDGLVPASYDAAWARALPHAKTARIAGAGHLPMVEAQGAFTTLVNDFLG